MIAANASIPEGQAPPPDSRWSASGSCQASVLTARNRRRQQHPATLKKPIPSSVRLDGSGTALTDGPEMSCARRRVDDNPFEEGLARLRRGVCPAGM